MNKQRMKKCCMDRGNYPFVILDNYGEGIRGKKYFTDVTRKPREVRLVITSYRGICWDAQHYYATLCEFGAPIKVIGGDPRTTCRGWLGEDTELFNNIDIGIELWRKITKKERTNNPGRYRDYETTNGWCDKNKLIAFGKEVFAARFSGDWVLKIEDNT